MSLPHLESVRRNKVRQGAAGDNIRRSEGFDTQRASRIDKLQTPVFPREQSQSEQEAELLIEPASND
jgi:hypothetical protein